MRRERIMQRQSEKTQMVHARIDPRLKKSAERVFREIGISTTEAIRLFLKQSKLMPPLPALRPLCRLVPMPSRRSGRTGMTPGFTSGAICGHYVRATNAENNQ